MDAVAKERGASQAQIALAWLRSKPIVAAPIVGALAPKHIDAAVAALSVTLTDDEIADSSRITHPGWTIRVSDPVMLARAVELATGFKTAAA